MLLEMIQIINDIKIVDSRFFSAEILSIISIITLRTQNITKMVIYFWYHLLQESNTVAVMCNMSNLAFSCCVTLSLIIAIFQDGGVRERGHFVLCWKLRTS